MERRNFLEKFGMGAAALGTIAAGADPAFATCPTCPPGPTPDRNSFTASQFCAYGDGTTDDTCAIQNAINAVHSMGGGTIYMIGTVGRNFRCDGQLSFHGKIGVRLVGSIGPSGPASSTARIFYTGTASCFISMKSSFGNTLESLQVSYTSTSFFGNLIETGHAVGGGDSGYLLRSLLAHR